jgi:hypothetical protein
LTAASSAPERRTQKMPLGTRRSFTRGTPRGLFGRFDGSPFIIAEFVAHDSRLRYGSLNHVASPFNLQRPIAAAADTLNLLPLLRHCGHG